MQSECHPKYYIMEIKEKFVQYQYFCHLGPHAKFVKHLILCIIDYSSPSVFDLMISNQFGRMIPIIFLFAEQIRTRAPQHEKHQGAKGVTSFLLLQRPSKRLSNDILLYSMMHMFKELIYYI